MKRRWVRAGLVLAMAGTLFSTGCWGLILYGRPGPGRNQGPVDYGVIVLDLLFGGLIAVTIDACAGTLRRPAEYTPSRWSQDENAVDRYKQLGYRETQAPLQLKKTLAINVRPEDVKINGDRRLEVVWRGVTEDVVLYDGLVKNARGLNVPTTQCRGEGTLEVRLDGKCSVAWNARAPSPASSLAAR